MKAGWRASSLASIEAARTVAYLAYTNVCNELKRNTEFEVYDPNLIKLFVAANRTANKDEMYEKAVSRFSQLKGLKYQEDEFDAIYLALYYLSGKGKNEHPGRSKKQRKI